MKDGPKFLLAISLIVIALIVWYRYDQYVNQRNFPIYAAVACDPSEGTCFVMDCSTAEDEECDTTPYKKVEVLASEAPACLEEHTCDSFTCAPGSSCTEMYCEEETLEEGEICFMPEEVVIEEEEETAEEQMPLEVEPVIQ